MSPEQANGGPSYRRSQRPVWSLPAWSTRCSPASHLFPGRQPQAIIAKRLSTAPPSISLVRPGFPPHVSVTLNRALARAPAYCSPTSTAFAAALDGRGANTPTVPVPAAPSRTRWWVFGGVAVAALGLILAFAHLGRGRTAAVATRAASPDSAVIELRERADRAYAQRTAARDLQRG